MAEVQQIQESNFEIRYLCGELLPPTGIKGDDIDHRAARALWRYLLHDQNPSQVSFLMISRMARFVVAYQPASACCTAANVPVCIPRRIPRHHFTAICSHVHLLLEKLLRTSRL